MTICRGDIVQQAATGYRGRVLDVWAKNGTAWVIWRHHQHEWMPCTLAGCQTCVPLDELTLVEKGGVEWLFR